MMVSAGSGTGCHTECGRRPVNQDAVLAVRLSDGRELVAVADGMGGHSAGEVASRRALEVVWQQLKAGVDLRSAVRAANVSIHAAAEGNPGWSGMGTTLVAMLRTADRYEIANVGDSRAYRITVNEVSQLTTDHSFAAEAMQHARLGNDTIAQSRWRNALTRALGTDVDVDVDVFGPFDTSEPHAVLLCTDGLYRTLSEDVLRENVWSAADPWTAARALASEAYRSGSSDNISAAVVVFAGSAHDHVHSETHAAHADPIRFEPQAAPQRKRRRRRKSRHTRRVELQLAATIGLLIIVVAILMRVW